jgi:hypothetical protein
MTNNPFTRVSLFMLASKTLIVRCKTKFFPKKTGSAGPEWPDGPLSVGNEIRIFTISKREDDTTLAYATCATDAGCLDYSIADYKIIHTIPAIMQFLDQQIHEFGQVPFWLEAIDCVAVKQAGDNTMPASPHTPSLLLSYQDFQRRCSRELHILKDAPASDSDALVLLSNRLLGFREKHSRIACQSGTFV